MCYLPRKEAIKYPQVWPSFSGGRGPNWRQVPDSHYSVAMCASEDEPLITQVDQPQVLKEIATKAISSNLDLHRIAWYRYESHAFWKDCSL